MSQSSIRTESLLVAIGGRISSGKTTIANHLISEHGFHRLSYSDLLKELARVIQMDTNSRLILSGLGQKLTDLIGHEGFTYLLLRNSTERRIVIDGLRNIAGHNYLKANYKKYFLIFLDTPGKKRFDLYNKKIDKEAGIDYQRFSGYDEMPGEKGIDLLREVADISLTFDELRLVRVDEFIKEKLNL